MPDSIIHLLPTCISSLMIEEKGDAMMTVNAKCIFPATFSGFKGHFPQKPILPAVIQLATVRCIAELALKHPLQVKEYSRTKFKAMISPNEEVLFHLSLGKITTGIQGKFKILSQDQKTIASGNCNFTRF
jgi:3-hydroxyacyl-[acyl-carrier-protein] dehydratase